MEENGRKRGKMRNLQEGNAGKLKGMLDTEWSRWKTSKEPKVSGEQWPLGFRPRQETRNEEQQSLASGAKAAQQSQADGKKSKESKVNGEQCLLGFGPRQFVRGWAVRPGLECWRVARNERGGLQARQFARAWAVIRRLECRRVGKNEGKLSHGSWEFLTGTYNLSFKLGAGFRPPVSGICNTRDFS